FCERHCQPAKDRDDSDDTHLGLLWSRCATTRDQKKKERNTLKGDQGSHTRIPEFGCAAPDLLSCVPFPPHGQEYGAVNVPGQRTKNVRDCRGKIWPALYHLTVPARTYIGTRTNP